jgi:hypothetical protein
MSTSLHQSQARQSSNSGPQLDERVRAEESLGSFLDRQYDGIDAKVSHLPRDERKWTRALWYWYTLNAIVLAGHDENAKDEDSKVTLDDLSAAQKTSFRLLHDWWTAQYQWPEISLAYILQIVDKCGELLTESEEDEALVRQVMDFLQLSRWPARDIEVTLKAECYKYNSTMYKLWIFELDNSPHDAHLDNLRQFRRDAILASWAQQMTFMSFSEALASVATEEVASRYLPKPDRKARYSVLRPNLPLRCGPDIQSCPWLETGWTGLQEDMPYYLWDREANCTIATSGLATFVAYTCISHTWGRYTIPPPPALPEKVYVPGVPWTVPRNSNFDVVELGDRLIGLRCNTRYVWIDLFCIPQDGSELMQVEIGRQASIFQNATFAVAWLNDVESFDALRQALIIMSYSLLALPDGCDEWDVYYWAIDTAWEKIGTQPSGLLYKREGRFSWTHVECNPWFTSLWTLQELCLRPDMWLCSRDWEMLSITREEHMPILGIVALWQSHQHIIRTLGHKSGIGNFDDGLNPYEHGDPEDTREQLGVALTEIKQWFKATALDRLAYLTRADILAIGDRRVCLSRRAEAIMSCLGTTKWYNQAAYSSHETNLVLNKYPLAFVQEVQAADPMNFFGDLVKHDHLFYSPQGLDMNIALNPSNRHDLTRPAEYSIIWAHPRGSMLPFSLYGSVITPATDFFAGAFDPHPSLSTWTVRTDGRVYIPSACILASTNTSFGPFQHGTVTILGVPDTDEDPPDFQEWVASRSFGCHAVVVSSRTYYSRRGVFLRFFNGVVLGLLEEGMYVRLGHFLSPIHYAAMPEAKRVDWLVA